IARNNHLRQMLDHLKLLLRKEKRLVCASRRTRNSRRGFVYMILCARERPFFKSWKRPRNRRNSDVSQNLAPFYPLSAHSTPSRAAFCSGTFAGVLHCAKAGVKPYPFLHHLHLSLWQPFPGLPRLICATRKSGPCTIGQCLIKDVANHTEPGNIKLNWSFT